MTCAQNSLALSSVKSSLHTLSKDGFRSCPTVLLRGRPPCGRFPRIPPNSCQAPADRPRSESFQVKLAVWQGQAGLGGQQAVISIWLSWKVVAVLRARSALEGSDATSAALAPIHKRSPAGLAFQDKKRDLASHRAVAPLKGHFWLLDAASNFGNGCMPHLGPLGGKLIQNSWTCTWTSQQLCSAGRISCSSLSHRAVQHLADARCACAGCWRQGAAPLTLRWCLCTACASACSHARLQFLLLFLATMTATHAKVAIQVKSAAGDAKDAGEALRCLVQRAAAASGCQHAYVLLQAGTD